MRAFINSFRPTVILLALFTLLLGILYPLFMTGVGQLLFHQTANGTLVIDKSGKIIGSEWIGQGFVKPEYFHSRPSSAGTGYDGASSSGSNLGPTSQKLIDALSSRASAYRTENKLATDAILPSDAVSGSASGLDPHISVANAQLQAARIAAARGISEETIKKAIQQFTEGRTWGIFGEPRVNVLRINLALDELQ